MGMMLQTVYCKSATPPPAGPDGGGFPGDFGRCLSEKCPIKNGAGITAAPTRMGARFAGVACNADRCGKPDGGREMERAGWGNDERDGTPS